MQRARNRIYELQRENERLKAQMAVAISSLEIMATYHDAYARETLEQIRSMDFSDYIDVSEYGVQVEKLKGKEL
jgi:hypothetical protein